MSGFPRPSTVGFSDYSFYKHYQGLIRSIMLSSRFQYSIEEKEEMLYNLINITNKKHIQEMMYNYVQGLQEIQYKYSGQYLDLERFYKGDSLPFPNKSFEQLDSELENYRNTSEFKESFYRKVNTETHPNKMIKIAQTLCSIGNPFVPRHEIERGDSDIDLEIIGRKINISKLV